MNIESAIIKGRKVLKDKLILTADLDTELLLAKAINKSREYIFLNPQKKINKSACQNFERLIKKRSLKKPIAYLTNTKFFWNSEFIVSKDTPIPRPDTELIVEVILKLTKSKNKINILDVGVGSGCILL